MSLQYYELPKLPQTVSTNDALQLWLKLFDADTEEELQKIEKMEVPVMQEAINAYRSVTATKEFKVLERMRSDARRNEASALLNAKCEGHREGHREGRREGHREGHREGEAHSDAKWQGVVAEKEAEIARLRSMLKER
jgi:flagellar biosynthesis/type III secretory pathway protein FliH